MKAERIFKPTNHKMECIICKEEIKKGEKCIKISQTMYPGVRVGYICYKHLSQEELRNKKFWK